MQQRASLLHEKTLSGGGWLPRERGSPRFARSRLSFENRRLVLEFEGILIASPASCLPPPWNAT